MSKEPEASDRTKMAAASSGANSPSVRLVSPSKALEPKAAKVPTKRSRHAKNKFIVFFNLLMTFAVLGTLVVLGVVYFGKLQFMEKGPLEENRTIVVRDGWSLARIAGHLESRGIISSQLLFRLGVRAYRSQSDMKAGEYAFKPQMSMYEVMNVLRSGKGIVHRISLPEGLTSQQIFERIANNPKLVGDMPEEVAHEGSLMPDTYPFQRGMKRKELIDQLKSANKKFLADVWQRRAPGLPIKTPEELLILASIVEKETGKATERPQVASVFINRLKKGMRLQSDPTVIYGIFGGAGKPKNRPIYKSDLKKQNDYNTYVINGLPKGPIANPGRASLEAVANPSNTNDLYFVADGTGGHIFAKTLKEHEKNVVRWRAIEKQRALAAQKKAQTQQNNSENTNSDASN